MHLRPATPADRELLEYWDEKPHVIECYGEDDDDIDWAFELPRDVDWREYLIAEVDGRPIGIVVIIDPLREETRYWGDCEPNLRAIDIWIGEEADLGVGHGSQMMRLALDRCFSDPAVTAVLIDPIESNTKARRFYERVGFREIDRRVFENELCTITRADWSASGGRD